MALQLGALRDALLDAGASEAKAALAAEELAGYEDRFDGLERRLDQVEHKIDGLRGEMNQQFTSQQGEMNERFASQQGEMNERFASLRSEMSERFASLRSEMNERFASADARFAEMGGRMTRIDWMLGTLIVLVLGVLGRLLLVH